MTALDLDDEDVRDLGRALVLLRGWKVRCDKPMRKHLEALETLCRRSVLLRVVVRAPVDCDTADVEDHSMTQVLWLTTRQASESLQISDALLRKRIHEGRLHAVREGKGFRIRRDELERFVEEEQEVGTK